jgi:hypothetical protein
MLQDESTFCQHGTFWDSDGLDLVGLSVTVNSIRCVYTFLKPFMPCSTSYKQYDTNHFYTQWCTTDNGSIELKCVWYIRTIVCEIVWSHIACL